VERLPRSISSFDLSRTGTFLVLLGRIPQAELCDQIELLQKIIRLWVICRFIESRWRCWGDDTIIAANPKDPFYSWESPPPYLDYQFASVIIQRILVPLRDDILRDLQSMVNEHKPKDWYVTFLASFILLHNYELQMMFQLQFAARRQSPVSFCFNLRVTPCDLADEQRCDIWTCHSCEQPTQAPRPSSRISTTAAKASGHSGLNSTGVRQS
jgi:hypothetical protein